MKLLSSLALVLMFVSTNAFATEISGYPLDQVAANTYVVHGPLEVPSVKNKGFMNNPAFVVTKTGVVVVDPGSSVYVGRMLLKKIKSVTKKPVTHVLNTHIHGDHWLGNQAFADEFPNLIIMAHPEMIKKAKKGEAEEWISIMSKSTAGLTDGTRAVIPDKATKDKQVLKIGGMHFRIHAPDKAHSFTDIMIEVVEESVIFLGDNVLYKRIPRMDDGTFKGNVAACQLAIDLGLKTYVPGHGLSGDNKGVVQFMNYLNIIYAEAGKHYEDGLSDFEMKPKILIKLKDYRHWSGFDQQVGKHISLAILEYERDAF